RSERLKHQPTRYWLRSGSVVFAPVPETAVAAITPAIGGTAGGDTTGVATPRSERLEYQPTRYSVWRGASTFVAVSKPSEGAVPPAEGGTVSGYTTSMAAARSEGLEYPLTRQRVRGVVVVSGPISELS